MRYVGQRVVDPASYGAPARECRIVSIVDGQSVLALPFGERVGNEVVLHEPLLRIRRYGDEGHNVCCADCVRYRPHTDAEHEEAVARAQEEAGFVLTCAGV